MECKHCKAMWKPFLSGQLQGEAVRQMRDHVLSCPGCRSRLRAEDLVEILPFLDESIEPTEDFSPRFYAQLASRRRPIHASVAPKRSWMPRWAWSLAAAGVVLFVVVAGVYNRPSGPRTPDTPAALYTIEMAENLGLLKDMALIEDLDFFEDLDVIENLPRSY